MERGITPRKREAVSEAVGVVTAVLDGDHHLAARLLNESMAATEEGAPPLGRMTNGLISLVNILLVDLSEASRMTPEEILQRVATQYGRQS